MLIKRSGVDARVRDEARMRAKVRRDADVHRGLTRSGTAQRGDFRLCREADKLTSDYKRFKDPRDRDKIKSNMEQQKREYQRNHVLGK